MAQSIALADTAATFQENTQVQLHPIAGQTTIPYGTAIQFSNSEESSDDIIIHLELHRENVKWYCDQASSGSMAADNFHLECEMLAVVCDLYRKVRRKT